MCTYSFSTCCRLPFIPMHSYRMPMQFGCMPFGYHNPSSSFITGLGVGVGVGVVGALLSRLC